MPLTPRVRSASKADFMSGLGLTSGDQLHENLYVAMKREAISAFNSHMRGRRDLLRPQYANCNPPFAANQFTDDAFNTTVRYVWQHADPHTRIWYDRAATPSGDNWIVAWMLYHICRYRDSRNSRAQSRNFHDDDNLDNNGEGHSSPQSTRTNGYYDPARNGYAN